MSFMDCHEYVEAAVRSGVPARGTFERAQLEAALLGFADNSETSSKRIRANVANGDLEGAVAMVRAGRDAQSGRIRDIASAIDYRVPVRIRAARFVVTWAPVVAAAMVVIVAGIDIADVAERGWHHAMWAGPAFVGVIRPLSRFVS